MSTKAYEIIPFGDSGYLVKFPIDTYSDVVTQQIHSVIGQLRAQSNWEELVPGYNSLLAYFCPDKFSPAKAQSALHQALKLSADHKPVDQRIIDIPVCYGGDFGPDMQAIEQSSGLSEAEIISLHSQQIYTVCMMGFVPGFTFLSAAPEQLHHNRHETPRTVVPAGSVGIAGWQTGIYGIESPGGWQLIGRTPYAIFDPDRKNPFLLEAGNQVRFVSISARAFETVK